jgi:hypothetical protein
MSLTILASAPTMKAAVRFKRCPECGDVTLMTAPICGCCDRTYVTTARFVRQAMVQGLVANLAPNPYLYNNPDDFVVLNQPARPAAATQAHSPIAVVAAVLAQAWLGMILNGQKAKGVVMLMATIVLLVCGLLVAQESQVLMLFAVVAGVGAYLVGLVDVILIANRVKNGEIVREWDWF